MAKGKMSVGRKILIGVTIAAAAVGLMLATPQGREVIDIIIPGTTQVEKTQLQTPGSFNFVEETKTLTWEGVENATEYYVEYTVPDVGTFTYNVAVPSFIVPSYDGAMDGEQISFSVVAKGDTNYYKNSEEGLFSYTLTNINQQYWEEAYDSVYVVLKEVLKSTDLGMTFKLTELLALDIDGTNLNIVLKGTKSGEERLVTSTIDLSSKPQYLAEDLNSLSSVRNLVGIFENFKSSEYTTISNVVINQSLDVTEGLSKSEESGIFADYVNAGYTITEQESTVTNIREESGNYMFDVFGVYKATHENGDVVYFSANNTVSVPMDQAPETNYIDYFNQTGNGTVVENSESVTYNDTVQEVLEELSEMRQEILAQQATMQP